MKVIRVVCPQCKAEKRIKEDKGNTREYSEVIVTQKCPHCLKITTSEDRLLEAIFGSQEEPYLW